MIRRPPRSTLFPYPPLFRSVRAGIKHSVVLVIGGRAIPCALVVDSSRPLWTGRACGPGGSYCSVRALRPCVALGALWPCVTLEALRTDLPWVTLVTPVALGALRTDGANGQIGQQRNAEVVVTGHDSEGATVRVRSGIRNGNLHGVRAHGHADTHGRDLARVYVVHGDICA